MSKLSLIAFVVAGVLGCKGKAAEKSAAGSGSAPHIVVAPTQISYGGLASVAGTGPKVVEKNLAASVWLRADGSLELGNKPTSLATLANDAGLPAIAKRRPSAFGAAETGTAATGTGGPGSGVGSADPANPTDIQFARLGHPEPATGVPAPATRATSAFAIAHPHDVTAGVVVFADAKAPATVLVDILATTGGFIAVNRDNGFGALPYAFDRQQPPFAAPNKTWTEIRLGAAIELETVPGKPVAIAGADKLGEAITAAKATAVDILVAPHTKVSDVVAVLEQLRAAKIDAVGLGRVPAAGSPDLAARGEKGPRILAWDFFMQDMDKTDASGFRKPIDAALEPALACYRAALAKTPDLAGTARVELVVQADGKVKEMQALGAAQPLAACATSTLKTVTFPKGAAAAKVVAQLAFVPR